MWLFVHHPRLSTHPGGRQAAWLHDPRGPTGESCCIPAASGRLSAGSHPRREYFTRCAPCRAAPTGRDAAAMPAGTTAAAAADDDDDAR